MIHLTRKTKNETKCGCNSYYYRSHPLLFPGFLLALAVSGYWSVNCRISTSTAKYYCPDRKCSKYHQGKNRLRCTGKDTTIPSFIISVPPAIGQFVTGSISSFAVNLLVLDIFVLYFMLIGGQRMGICITEKYFFLSAKPIKSILVHADGRNFIS